MLTNYKSKITIVFSLIDHVGVPAKCSTQQHHFTSVMTVEFLWQSGKVRAKTLASGNVAKNREGSSTLCLSITNSTSLRRCVTSLKNDQKIIINKFWNITNLCAHKNDISVQHNAIQFHLLLSNFGH